MAKDPRPSMRSILAKTAKSDSPWASKAALPWVLCSGYELPPLSHHLTRYFSVFPIVCGAESCTTQSGLSELQVALYEPGKGTAWGHI